MAKRETPVLGLSNELPDVVSQDFNLYYKPQAEPEVAGAKELFASLDNFVNDAGKKLVIGSELKQKKENSAKALEDYNSNKQNFRDAVKNGLIDKTSNPYYIEKYKELTLNDYANRFIDKLGKNYQEKGVENDTRDGAFGQFYKSELDSFIKENNLGFFNPIELEKGFFKDTSSYRAILENNHRQKQLKIFEEKFNEKVSDRIFGIFEKFKDFKSSDLGEFSDGKSKFEFLGDKIQKEMEDLVGVGEENVTDRVLEGLEKYVTTTRDYNYAKEIIANLPEFIKGGTGSFADIGKVKRKQEELLTLLIKNQEDKTSADNNLEKSTNQKVFNKTYQFLEGKEDDENFNINDYRNSSDRTTVEIRAIDTYIKDQQFDGGNSDNNIIMQQIGELIDNGEYEKAEDLARSQMRAGNIRKSTYTSLINSDIPNARLFKNKPVFSNPEFQAMINGLNGILSSQAKAGDKLQASQAKTYINTRMLRWYKSNRNQKKYITDDGSFNEDLFETDFTNQFRNIIEVMKTAKSPNGDALFPALEFNESQSNRQLFNSLDKQLLGQ